MASTNKTTNYELSQFLGTDKPAWLSDYNTDMSKIDTQMKANADAATAASGSASTANTAIGTLASLTTTDKTSVVAAVNEVVSDVTTAQNTANSASTAANTANTNLAKFNLSNKSVLTSTTNKGTIDTTISNVQFATDTTNSIFKIYGRIYITNLIGQSGTLTIKLGETSLRPATAYSINTGVIVARVYNDGKTDTVPRNLTIDTNGDITINDTVGLSGNVTTYNAMIPPCLYFNTDFGDV